MPQKTYHHEAVEALAKNNRVVILLSHGNKYKFPKGWMLPHNVVMLEYDLTLENIEENIHNLKNILSGYGIDLYSRHLDDGDPLPMLLAGSCLALSPGTKVAFVNKPDQYSNAKQDESIKYKDTDWDILN